MITNEITTKVCPDCKIEKFFMDFYRAKSRKNGLYAYCKDCTRNQAQKWYSTEKGRFTRERYKKSPKGIEVNKKWRKSVKGKLSSRKNSLKHNYGMTLDQWNILFQKQNGACLICKRSDKKLTVDHDHKTGKVRGLLCNWCNTRLGWMENNLELILNYINTEEKYAFSRARCFSRTDRP